MPPEREESSIERVKKQLAARNARTKLHARRKLMSKTPNVEADWKNDSMTALPELSDQEVKEHELDALRTGRVPDADPVAESMHVLHATRMSRLQHSRKILTERFMRTLLIASIVFFVISGIVATYVLLFGNRQVSCSNVRFEVHAPTSVPSGAELVLNVRLTNNNKATLQNAELSLDYPDNTRTLEREDLRFQRSVIGTIEKGETTTYTSRAVLNGSEQEQKTILSKLTFGIEGSNATWECKSPFIVTLGTAPITIAVDALNEISSGQEMELRIDVTANSEEVVPNARLIVKYPYGFDFQSANPKPSAGETVWNLGDVQPNSLRTIVIKGIVTGFETEQRSIRFELGEGDTSDTIGIATPLQLFEHVFTVTKPFLQTTLIFDSEKNNTPVYTVIPGEDVSGSLLWVNTTNEPLYDVQIEAVLPDAMVERRSVDVRNGFFRSEINTMVWTPQTYDVLKMIEPGQSGVLDFDFSTTKFIERTGAINPSFNLSFDVRARRISDAITVEQYMRKQATREIRFMTDLDIERGAVYSVGPFTNTGPHPPAPDTETTYTVVMRITNTINDVEDAQLIAELPINVQWLNRVFPGEERVTFNPVSRKVVWNTGTISEGSGYKKPIREVSFQVALIPSVTQIKTLPPLLQNIEFSGVDSFTETVLKLSAKDPVDTALVGDPFFPDEKGFVRE